MEPSVTTSNSGINSRLVTFLTTNKYSVLILTIGLLITVSLAAVLGAFAFSLNIKPNPTPVPAEFTSCEYNEEIYDHASTFDASDSCNTCLCNDGEVVCTDIACPTPTTDPGISNVSDNGSNQASAYTSDPKITCTWEESNVQQVTVNIGTTPGAADISSRSVSAGVETVTFDNLNLPKVGIYYCSVQGSKDSQKTELASSDGIFIDASAINVMGITAFGASLKPNCSLVEGIPMNAALTDIKILFWVQREGAVGTEFSQEPDGAGWSTTFKQYDFNLYNPGSYNSCNFAFDYQSGEYDTATAYAKAISKQTGKELGIVSRKVIGEVTGSGLKHN